jgi:xanthine dehydrogenase/oxidase
MEKPDMLTDTTLLFYLNGKRIELQTGDSHLHPEWTLLEFLREVEGRRGTKLGCGQGMCGACTVAVQYWDTTSQTVRLRPMNACILPMCSLDLAAVYTVEGVGDTRCPHPVQERLCEMHGTQCGYCTPGVVMSMYTLLANATSSPSPSMLEKAIDGNLCRCTGYRPILDAIKSFAGNASMDFSTQSVNNYPAELRQRAAAGAGSLHLTGPKCVLPGGAGTKGCDGSTVSNTHLLQRAHWYRPSTLLEMLQLRLELGATARVVGGETDFMKQQRRKHQAFISPQHVPELREISIAPTTAAAITLAQQEQHQLQHSLRVGAGVTIAELLDWITATLSASCPTSNAIPPSFTHGLEALHQQLVQVATPQSRSSAAFGSFVHASDVAPLLVAMTTTIELASSLASSLASTSSPTSALSRSVTAASLLVLDPSTGMCQESVADHEVVVAITIALRPRCSFVRAIKAAPRRLGATGLVTLAMHVEFVVGVNSDFNDSSKAKEWHATRVLLCVGGMSHSHHSVVRAIECEEWLEGRAWTRSVVDKACVLLREELEIAAAEHDKTRQVRGVDVTGAAVMAGERCRREGSCSDGRWQC